MGYVQWQLLLLSFEKKEGLVLEGIKLFQVTFQNFGQRKTAEFEP